MYSLLNHVESVQIEGSYKSCKSIFVLKNESRDVILTM